MVYSSVIPMKKTYLKNEQQEKDSRATETIYRDNFAWKLRFASLIPDYLRRFLHQKGIMEVYVEEQIFQWTSWQLAERHEMYVSCNALNMNFQRKTCKQFPCFQLEVWKYYFILKFDWVRPFFLRTKFITYNLLESLISKYIMSGGVTDCTSPI